MESSFHALDWVIVVAYLASMFGVGVYFSRRQTSFEHYVLADRRMGWLPVGLSLMAALNSGMDYLMQPSSTIKYGIVLAVGVLSWIAVYPWVATIVFPFYRRLNVVSAYEYLEARFDVRVRTLGAGIFLVWRLGWMATAMYVPSLAVNAATGGQVDLVSMTIVVGVVVTFYTALGGIQAVIWNDVVQFCVMFGGLAATVVLAVSSVDGGLSAVWQVAGDAGKLNVLALGDPAATGVISQMSAFFRQPVNVVALLVALVVGRMAQYTTDQVMVQRLQTTRSSEEARRAFVINAAGDMLWTTGLCLVGLALFAYFRVRTIPEAFQTDKLLPYFMSIEFPTGVVGLVTAAIMAASLSSIDSAINSCSSVVVVDFYYRLWRGRATSSLTNVEGDRREQLRLSRLATIVVGLLGTLLACNVSRLGSLIEIANKLINAFSGPLFGIFLLAMFSHRATATAVLAGGVAGAATSYYVAYSSSLSFLWPSTFGLVATVVVGMLITAASPAKASASGGLLTWKAVMSRHMA